MIEKFLRDYGAGLLIFAALVAVAGVTVVYPKWRAAVDRNLDARANPYHIAGDLYFVGAPDVTSFLLLGPEGDVLIGGGRDNSPHKIIDNLEELGFDIKNVRALLATGARADDAGGLAGLQQASGAELWANDYSADAIARGEPPAGAIVDIGLKLFAWAGVTRYPAARVDHRVKDGETIHVGPLAFTAHITPHAPFCTTWTFTVRDHRRDLHVVHRCGLEVSEYLHRRDAGRYAGRLAEFERSFETLRGLPVDIWLTSQGREYGRFRKYDASLHAEDPVAPFIDPDGYRQSIDEAEARLRAVTAEPQAGGS